MTRATQFYCPFIYKDSATFTIACPICGFTDTLKWATPIDRLQRSRVCKVRSATSELGWGDKTERWLRRVGITKTRWVRWQIWWRRTRKQTLGCGCEKRQERINQWGWRWRYWIQRKTWPLKWAVTRFYCRLLGGGAQPPPKQPRTFRKGRPSTAQGL